VYIERVVNVLSKKRIQKDFHEDCHQGSLLTKEIWSLLKAQAQAARASTSLYFLVVLLVWQFSQICIISSFFFFLFVNFANFLDFQFFSKLLDFLFFSKFLDFQTFITFARAYSLKSFKLLSNNIAYRSFFDILLHYETARARVSTLKVVDQVDFAAFALC